MYRRSCRQSGLSHSDWVGACWRLVRMHAYLEHRDHGRHVDVRVVVGLEHKIAVIVLHGILQHVKGLVKNALVVGLVTHKHHVAVDVEFLLHLCRFLIL